MPSRDGLRMFRELNLPLNAWFYVREFVRATTNRTGIPKLVLKSLRRWNWKTLKNYRAVYLEKRLTRGHHLSLFYPIQPKGALLFTQVAVSANVDTVEAVNVYQPLFRAVQHLDALLCFRCLLKTISRAGSPQSSWG